MQAAHHALLAIEQNMLISIQFIEYRAQLIERNNQNLYRICQCANRNWSSLGLQRMETIDFCGSQGEHALHTCICRCRNIAIQKLGNELVVRILD